MPDAGNSIQPLLNQYSSQPSINGNGYQHMNLQDQQQPDMGQLVSENNREDVIRQQEAQFMEEERNFIRKESLEPNSSNFMPL